MLKPSTQTCEVMADGAWRILGLDEAKALHRDVLKSGARFATAV
jgi:hypothetical protein